MTSTNFLDEALAYATSYLDLEDDMDRYAHRRESVGSALRSATARRRALEQELWQARSGGALGSGIRPQDLSAQLHRAQADERRAEAMLSALAGPTTPVIAPLPSPRLPPSGDSVPSRRRRHSIASMPSSSISSSSSNRSILHLTPRQSSSCIVTSHTSLPITSVEHLRIISARGRDLVDFKERLRQTGVGMGAGAVVGVQVRWLPDGTVEGEGMAVRYARPRR